MENEGMPPSLFTVSSWVSFCFASFLPLESDVPDWVACPCPCGDPGMVLRSAPHYLWSLASAQVSGEELSTPRGEEAEFRGLGPVQPPHRLQKACLHGHQ